MTAKQKQLILCCFRLLPPEAVDGIWGKQSAAATRKLQRGLGITEDGDFGNSTADSALTALATGKIPEFDADSQVPAAENFWDEIVFFTPEEFRCKCGGRCCSGFPSPVQPLLAQLCDRARKWSGHPITVVSGLRCPDWNRIQKGVANSQHMYGEAADVYFYGTSPNAALAWLQSQPEVRYAYRIEGSNNIHFDIPPVGR